MFSALAGKYILPWVVGGGMLLGAWAWPAVQPPTKDEDERARAYQEYERKINEVMQKGRWKAEQDEIAAKEAAQNAVEALHDLVAPIHEHANLKSEDRLPNQHQAHRVDQAKRYLDQSLSFATQKEVRELRSLQLQYQKADEETKKTLRAKIEANVTAQFEDRMKRQKDRLEQLKQEVATVEKSLKRREELGAQIIARRLAELLGEKDELSWDESPTGLTDLYRSDWLRHDEMLDSNQDRAKAEAFETLQNATIVSQEMAEQLKAKEAEMRELEFRLQQLRAENELQSKIIDEVKTP